MMAPAPAGCLQLAQHEIGDTVLTLAVPQVSRQMLAIYAGASGDHVALHIDTDAARRAGMPDVFCHGMLVAAWLGRMLTSAIPQDRLRSLSLRFVGITHLYNQVSCRARLAQWLQVDGQRCARLDIEAINQYGEHKAVGHAMVAVPPDR